jgi:hypothetical protein
MEFYESLPASDVIVVQVLKSDQSVLAALNHSSVQLCSVLERAELGVSSTSTFFFEYLKIAR